MKSQRVTWAVFIACTLLVLASLAWVTSSMLRMERAELEAREFANHQELLRLALWRMDSWMAPRVAREAARPYTDYQALTPQTNLYNKMLEPIDAGDILTASPLLPYRSDYFRLHFQIDQTGSITSPQAPSRAELEKLPPALIPTAQWVANDREVQELTKKVEVEELIGCVMAVEESMEQAIDAPPAPQELPIQLAEADAQFDREGSNAGAMPQTEVSTRQRPQQMEEAAPRQTANAPAQVAQQRSQQEWSKRKENYAKNIQDASQIVQQQTLSLGPEVDGSVVVGPLVPIWFGATDGAEGELMFVRRVRINGSNLFQGFICDWPKLRSALLNEIADLFAVATLLPNRNFMNANDTRQERAVTSLATLPASLNVPAPVCEAATGMTAGRVTAAMAWIVVLAGVGLTANTLRSSIAFGRKRSQFASAVTHELRTPLTTFKMYTDMLADGMVTNEEQKNEYLRTLQGESDRLARLVENVLSYARVEDGRQTPNSRAMTIGALLGRVLPQLERRAGASGMSLVIEREANDDAVIHTDDDAVGQILLNLVDNACKYARGAHGGAIQLRTAIENGSLALTVRDDGPGISAGDARQLFHAFKRGSTSEASQPGLGIGLTLSRALARRLGGDLRYLNNASPGASFELTVPLGVSTR